MPVAHYLRLRSGKADAVLTDAAAVGVGSGFDPPEGSPTVLTDGAALASVRAQHIAQALRMGFYQVRDGDLHIVADGVRIDALTREGTVLRFAVPPATRSLRLVCRAAVPAEVTAEGSDTRRLGAAVNAVAADGQIWSPPLGAKGGMGRMAPGRTPCAGWMATRFCRPTRACCRSTSRPTRSPWRRRPDGRLPRYAVTNLGAFTLRALTLTLLWALCAAPALAAGTLRVGLQDDPDALDPATSAGLPDRVVFASICDKLIDTDAQGGFVPQLPPPGPGRRTGWR